MNIHELFPALSYFLQTYLNQDFQLIFGNADAALQAYKAREKKQEQLKIQKEIKCLLQSDLNEQSLQELLLDEIGCNYYFPNQWSSAKVWLKHILKQLSCQKQNDY